MWENMKKRYRLLYGFWVCFICLWSMVSGAAITIQAAQSEYEIFYANTEEISAGENGAEETATEEITTEESTEENLNPGDTCEVDGVLYQLYNGTKGLEAKAISYTTALPENAVIPEEIIEKETKLSVTAIGDGAFQNASVKKLVFPDSIKSFGKDIIAGCAKLDIVENRSAMLFMLPEVMNREGYFFRCWRDENYNAIKSIASGSAYTLYTNYKYTLVFDSNGGSPVDSVTAFAYQCALAPADPVREGYTFAGWYTSPYFSEESRWDFAKDYRNYTTTVKLYAKWKKNEKKSYSVGAVSGFHVKGRRKHSLTLAWDRLSGVTGYQLYMYDNEKKDFVLYSSTATNKENKVTVYGLSAGKVYQFYVRAYSMIDGKRRHGEFTEILKTVTKPDKPKKVKLKASKKKQVRVQFKKVKACSGYELQISTKKSFSKKNTRTYRLGKGAKSKTIKKLKSKKKYYIRIRAYIRHEGKTYYGAYSRKRSIVCK